MTKRRNRGEGSLYWDEERQRWIATVYLGYTPAGKRRKRTASHKTKTGAKELLKGLLRDAEAGLATASSGYTVRQAVTDWLTYGLSDRDPNTIINRTILADRHIIPRIGSRKLCDLTADEVDEWLAQIAKNLSTRTLRTTLSILRLSIRRAQARDRVGRNVALLCDVPTGRPGRPSKSLSLQESELLIATAEAARSTMGTYIVVSLLTGARTEELRPLTWDHVDLNGETPTMQVWHSVRRSGDTKTKEVAAHLYPPATVC